MTERGKYGRGNEMVGEERLLVPNGWEVKECSWGWRITPSTKLSQEEERGIRSERRVLELLQSEGRKGWVKGEKIRLTERRGMDDSVGRDILVEQCLLGFYREVGINSFAVQVKSSFTPGAEDFLNHCLVLADLKDPKVSRSQRRKGIKNGGNGNGSKLPLDLCETKRHDYCQAFEILAKQRIALVVAGEWSDNNILAQLVLQMGVMSGLPEEEFLPLMYKYDREMVTAYERTRGLLQDLMGGINYSRILSGGNGHNC